MSSQSKIRVVVVDDSLFMRGAISKLLNKNPRFEVVGQASDGAMAVQKVAKLRPDVITMDFNMPIMNGVEAVRRIMKSYPTPIVMLSAHTTDGARETIEALEHGAVDFITKPSGEVSSDISRVGPELFARLQNAYKARVGRHVEARSTTSSLSHREKDPLKGLLKPNKQPSLGRTVVIVGISTGGPAALSKVLPEIPRVTHMGLVIVQHMPPTFTAALAKRLDSLCRIKVSEAKDGDKVREGAALIAPGGFHLEFGGDGSIRLTQSPPVNGCRPAADVTMKSAAKVFCKNLTGVVMTGMGKDGAEGMRAIKSGGGRTFVQDRESCVIFGMPKACIDLGVVDEVVALASLATTLNETY